MKIWLSLGAIAMLAAAACAAGEDNSEVTVAAETNLPRCDTKPPSNEEVTDPPTSEETAQTDTPTTPKPTREPASSSDAGATPQDCVSSSSGGSSSSSGQ